MWNLMTLDGCFEGPSSWDLGFHERAWGEEMERMSIEQLDAADTLLFGRVTYEGMASYWQTATGDIADRMNAIAKVVFSGTLPDATWSNARLVRTRAEDEVARLKSEPGNDILIFGSAKLTSSLMQRGLIDEYRIGIAPVVLGAGSPLFKPSPVPANMTLLDARPLKTGAVILRYAPESAA
jgi:dihydrofolate reductase